MKLLIILALAFASAVTSFASSTKLHRSSLKLKSTSANTIDFSANNDAKTTGLSNGKSTISVSTFNLAKSVIGAGVLSLPSGVAFLADESSALLPASIVCTLFGMVAAYSFSTIGKVCKETNSKSFMEAWEKSVNPKTAWLITYSITALCFLASLAYSIILGDSFASLFQTFNLPTIISQRSNTILLLSSLILLPLCSLKSLSALAPFSLLGLSGTLFTAIFMVIRLLDGSYAPGGKFFKDLVLKPAFKQRGGYSIASFNAFVLLSMLSTSFVAHYNAPAFYNELKDASMPRFNTVVKGGFIASILLFCLIMSVGFLTFGGSSLGFVLNNYSGKDLLATIARLAIGIALITGYPFTFSALRDGIMDIMNKKDKERDNAFVPVTLIGLTLLTSLALVLKDVGFVVSISGAMFGCSVMFIIPAIMNINLIQKNMKNMGKTLTKSNKLEIFGNYGMMGTGFIMAVIGVIVSVLKQSGKL